MKYIARFSVNNGIVSQCKDGEFVRFDDYLESRRNLKHSVDNLKSILAAINKIVRPTKHESLIEVIERINENQTY